MAGRKGERRWISRICPQHRETTDGKEGRRDVDFHNMSAILRGDENEAER